MRSALLAAVAPYTYSRGGPICVTQIENEYGSFGSCDTNPADAKYMNHLLSLASSHAEVAGMLHDALQLTVDESQGKRFPSAELVGAARYAPRASTTCARSWT